MASSDLILCAEAVTVHASEAGDDWLPKVSIVAYTGGAMRVEGWRYPVVIDLDRLTVPARVPLRYGHSSERAEGVGHLEAITRSGGRLVASGVISRDTPAARDVVIAAKRGYPWQASVGVSVSQSVMIRDGETGAANGRPVEGPAYIVAAGTLREISIVDIGADDQTTVSIAASGEKGGPMTPEPMPGDTTASEVLARAKRERERLCAIRALVEEAALQRGADIDTLERIAAQAEDEGWSAQQTELAILRATRPKTPMMRHERAPTPEVLTAALAMAAGVSDEVLAKDRDYGPQVVERAWPLRRSGLRGVIAAAIQASGRHAPHGGQELYSAVLDLQAAGFSTINIAGILSAAANKIVLEAFTAVQATYDLVADQRDFSNFHQHEIYRLDHLGEFARVAPDGELKHGRLAETQFANKLDTYGQMLVLPRQAVVNDDLGAFESLASQLARKARLAVEKALYLLVAEATDSFYTVTRNNRHTSNPLGIVGLATAEAAMLGQADADGDPIYAIPRYLLVPSALRWLADTIYTSATIQTTTTTDRGRPTDNPYRGRFEVISSPYLQAATIPGNSATTWYMLADPALLPAFQVGYLAGRRSPTIETADAEFNTLGLAMRCYWDFGVAHIDYRGASKSTA